MSLELVMVSQVCDFNILSESKVEMHCVKNTRFWNFKNG